jgi:hypothetical protein
VIVVKLQPEIEWSIVCRNLHITWTSEGAKSAWYVVMHGLIATNVRLHKIRLTDTTSCNRCGRRDTTLHRLRLWRGSGDLGVDTHANSVDE